MGVLRTRQCYSSLYNDCYYDSPWSNWGRWVVLAGVIVFVALAGLALACITNRRRRRRGMQPYRGTGWLGGQPQQATGTAPYYHNQQPQHQGPPYGGGPPQYNAQPEHQGYYGSGGANEGYYGAQQNGVELQSPEAVHHTTSGTGGYTAPPGPPPGHQKDGVVR